MKKTNMDFCDIWEMIFQQFSLCGRLLEAEKKRMCQIFGQNVVTAT